MFNLGATCTYYGAHGYCYSQAKIFEGKVYCPCYKQVAVAWSDVHNPYFMDKDILDEE